MNLINAALADKIPKKEKAVFTFAVFTQNMVFAFVSAYIMIFFTDFVGISPAEVGTLMLFARVFDAVNDPLMGVLTEKTRTKWGKFRPYLFGVAFPILVILYLLFTNIDGSYAVKLFWAYATYIVFWMVYTISDIPLWGLTSVISRSQEERMKLISMGKSVAPVAFIAVTVASVPLIELFGNDMFAYRTVAMIYGVMMTIGMILLATTARERVPHKPEVLPMKDILAFLKDNKYLRRILSSQACIFVIDNLVTAMVLYYATYNLQNLSLVPALSLAIVIPMIIGIIVATKLAKKIDKKKLLLASLVLRTIGYVAIFFLGWSDPILLIVAISIVALTFGVPEILLPSMMVETIDYMELKTGNRAEGIVWSTQTFIVKIGASLAGFILGHALTIIGFEPNVDQTEQTLLMMHGVLFLLPALLTALSILPMLGYDLTAAKYKEVMEQLEKKRERLN